MTEDDNVSVLKEAYALWNDSKANSMEHWMNLLDDHVEWGSISDHTPGMGFSRACQCKDDVARYFEEMGRDWEMLHYSVDEFIAQGDRVVVLANCAWRNRATGKSAETKKADVIRMKDGKIVEFFEFLDTAAASAAAQEECD